MIFLRGRYNSFRHSDDLDFTSLPEIFFDAGRPLTHFHPSFISSNLTRKITDSGFSLRTDTASPGDRADNEAVKQIDHYRTVVDYERKRKSTVRVIAVDFQHLLDPTFGERRPSEMTVVWTTAEITRLIFPRLRFSCHRAFASDPTDSLRFRGNSKS